jgi:hypothetical protein
LIGTALFWFLAHGPILALYQAYLLPTHAVGIDAPTWTAFPTPSAAMIATAMALSAFPVLLIALIHVSVAIPRNKLHVIAQDVRDRHTKLVQKYGNELVQVEVDAPRVNALERLRTLPRSAGAASQNPKTSTIQVA